MIFNKELQGVDKMLHAGKAIDHTLNLNISGFKFMYTCIMISCSNKLIFLIAVY